MIWRLNYDTNRNSYYYSQKMSGVSFQSLWETTNRGMPTTITPTISITRSFYTMSLALEIIFLLIFMGYFGMSIFRSSKKIKNPKFKMGNTSDDEENNSDEEEEEDLEDQKNTNDKLIYRFDEEDHEKEIKVEDVEDDFEPEKEEKEDEDQDEERDPEDQQYENYHYQKQDLFLEIDHKIMFVQPFLIGHVICNNLFACDVISIAMLLATLIIFFIFNIKGVGSRTKFLSMLFMIPGILSFLPLFLNDHDLTT